MTDQSTTEEISIKGAAERAPSPSAEIPPRSPSKTSPRRSRSLSKSQLSEEGETTEETPPLPDEPVPAVDGDAPPLPEEPLPATEEGEVPPLPSEPVPQAAEDDGWEPRLDPSSGQWYFLNRLTGLSQWENPRVPTDTYGPNTSYVSSGAPGTEPSSGAPGTYSELSAQPEPPKELYLGYNPKIHGDFDPNADYAKWHQPATKEAQPVDVDDAANMIGTFEQAGTFNRRTGAFQTASKGPETHNDENKSKRQMNAFFDVDRAANAHDGRSLKAERANKRMSKDQVKAFNDQRRAKKEQKRRDFLMS